MSRRFSAETIEQQKSMCSELFTAGVSTYEIAAKLDIDRRTVCNRLKAVGLFGSIEKPAQYVCSKGHVNPDRYVGGNCIPCARSNALEYAKANPPTREQKDRSNARMVKLNRAVKLHMVNAYGGVCKCCGEDEIEFITIGHIFNDGNEEKKLHGTGVRFYKYLRSIGYPQDRYRLECWNCNSAKGSYGYCPHEKGHRR